MQRKRGEGQRIIVLGTTTAHDLLPSPSKSGLRQAQSDQSNIFARTVVAPSIAPSAEAQFAGMSMLEQPIVAPDSMCPVTSLKHLALTTGSQPFQEDVNANRSIEEAKTRIEDINMRHLRDMLRRISPDPFQVNTLLSDPRLGTLIPSPIQCLLASGALIQVQSLTHRWFSPLD